MHEFLLGKMVNYTTIAIVAIVAAVGLLGLVIVESVNMPKRQQAFARGCPIGSPAFNARALLPSLAFNFYSLLSTMSSLRCGRKEEA
jgi:hypothetical protein